MYEHILRFKASLFLLADPVEYKLLQDYKWVKQCMLEALQKQPYNLFLTREELGWQVLIQQLCHYCSFKVYSLIKRYI